MTRLILLFALAACSPAADITPHASCGTPCTTSQQCADTFTSCRYCSIDGRCSSILPADPIGVDAGVDAP